MSRTKRESAEIFFFNKEGFFQQSKKGQSTLEYALIIAVVIAALVAINIYMQRGMQGRIKENVDDVGRQFDPSSNYSFAWNTSSSGQTVTVENRNTTTTGGVQAGSITSNISVSETITRSENETFGQ